ncbi:centrosomal protein of 120 kDa isoform X2 [Bactrocera oleae]|uniref:centrosomal protein of 120 kDa isoform X2 n=1 Tax=Bactrocera oleae TaxID=104688 RepID=UPI00387E6F11
MSNNAYSASESDASESADNTFCIFLHLVEGIGLHRRDGVGDFTERHKDKVILTASLNGVKFEVEGHSTETVTIFNSNCIWECELSDIKRMKTDNRPVKLEIFIKSGRTDTSPRRGIGSLLLPIRGVPVIAALKNVQLKLHWHKLNVLSSEWRQNKPEIYLLLVIVKKNLIDNGQFEVFLGKRKGLLNEGISPKSSETSLMLQSQSNVYVQLLEQVGLIQVGNNPDMDCDIFNVTLTFKQVKNLLKVLELEKNFQRQTSTFVFHYDFLGSTSQLEMVANHSDCYTINEKVSLTFKSSLKSLRLYFQRIFYIPISIYVNNTVVANFRLDFSKLLPEDSHFNTSKAFTKSGTFYFDRINKSVSPRMSKPSVDYIFYMQLVTSFSKKLNPEHGPLTEAYASYKIDEKGAAEITECYRNLDFPNTFQQKRAPYDPGQISSRNFTNFEMYERNYMKMQTDAFIIGRVLGENTELFTKSSEDFCRSTDSFACRLSRPILSNYPGNEQVQSLESISNIEISRASYTPIKPQNRSIGVNTDQLETDPEEMTMKIVRELEEWKAQQMEHFIKGLEQKEVEYLAELNKEWEQQRSILQARLEAKLSDCERLNAELEHAHSELNSNAMKHQETISIVKTVKQDIEKSYAEKFHQLDHEMQRLKDEMQQRARESAEREMEQAQKKCLAADVIGSETESEKLEMKMRIEQLEKQLTAMEKTHFSAEQLQGMLADLQKQTERFAAIEKAKDYYKAQWSKSARELHALQMTLLKQKKEALEEKKDVEFDTFLLFFII